MFFFLRKTVTLAVDQHQVRFVIPRSKRIERVIRNTFVRGLQETRQLFCHLPACRAILDIGGNVGYQAVTYALAAPTGCPIDTFEPSQRNFPFLEKNIAPYPNIVAHRIGLSHQDGEAFLSMPDIRQYPKLAERSDNTGLLSLYGQGKNRERITLRTLDGWARERDRSTEDHFIKVDAEGHEFPILQGATLFLAGKNVFQLEFNPLAMRMSGIPGERIIAFFAEYGYRPHLFREDALIPFDPACQSRPDDPLFGRMVDVLFFK
ncbi:MAG: FkbM family methyltransferase [Magnetococcales bacterium]|nr:FkbM family methyltransferase [Magnetococcales bacterium]